MTKSVSSILTDHLDQTLTEMFRRSISVQLQNFYQGVKPCLHKIPHQKVLSKLACC